MVGILQAHSGIPNIVLISLDEETTQSPGKKCWYFMFIETKQTWDLNISELR